MEIEWNQQHFISAWFSIALQEIVVFINLNLYCEALINLKLMIFLQRKLYTIEYVTDF